MFVRRRQRRPTSAVDEFWSWWTAGGDADVARAVEEREPARVDPVITAHVRAMDSRLTWELRRGNASANLLILSAGGNPRARVAAERWLLAAPPADALWGFRPARQADARAAASVVTVSGVAVPLAQLAWTMTVDNEHQRVDLVGHHPRFPLLDRDDRDGVIEQALEWLLGEDEVTRWVGSARTVDAPGIATTDTSRLLDEVRRLRAEHRFDRWALVSGAGPEGDELIATALRPLKWIDHLPLDQHISVTQRYAGMDPRGLPSGAELDRLQTAENDLAAALGGRALPVVYETSAGVRRMHLYADSEDTVADDVRAWTRGRAMTVAVTDDPGWTVIGYYC
jgi:hypothetical protein